MNRGLPSHSLATPACLEPTPPLPFSCETEPQHFPPWEVWKVSYLCVSTATKIQLELDERGGGREKGGAFKPLFSTLLPLTRDS